MWKFEKPFNAGRSNNEGAYGEWGGIVGLDRKPIVGCNEYDVFWGPNRAKNIAIMIAAPKMLAILQDIWNDGMQDGLSDDLRNRVESAIAEATLTDSGDSN